jgi:hypothetical protein
VIEPRGAAEAEVQAGVAGTVGRRGAREQLPPAPASTVTRAPIASAFGGLP